MECKVASRFYNHSETTFTKENNNNLFSNMPQKQMPVYTELSFITSMDTDRSCIYVHTFRWQVKSRHWTQSNLNHSSVEFCNNLSYCFQKHACKYPNPMPFWSSGQKMSVKKKNQNDKTIRNNPNIFAFLGRYLLIMTKDINTHIFWMTVLVQCNK